MSYYKYKNLTLADAQSSIQTEYDKKLQMIPDVIYPEYKKGGKSLYELAMYYQIEKYLIEEYIQKIETQHIQNTDNTYIVDTKNDNIL